MLLSVSLDRVSREREPEIFPSGEISEETRLADQLLSGQGLDESEVQSLVEMRYRQHLAQPDLQELFEQGLLGADNREGQLR